VGALVQHLIIGTIIPIITVLTHTIMDTLTTIVHTLTIITDILIIIGITHQTTIIVNLNQILQDLTLVNQINPVHQTTITVLVNKFV
jgi:hypothetical protein